MRFPPDSLIGRHWSYSQEDEVFLLGAPADRHPAGPGFLKLGMAKGEHLAIWTPNRSEYIIAELAAVKVGVVLVSIDTNAQPEQLEYLGQSDSEPPHRRRTKGTDTITTIRRLCPEIDRSEPGRLDCIALPGLKGASPDRGGGTPWACSPGTKSSSRGSAVPDHLIAERQRSCHKTTSPPPPHTSGTTGAPKGVMSSCIPGSSPPRSPARITSG